MKLVLSRKGFDSAWGGYPSPIVPKGTMVSLPGIFQQRPSRHTPKDKLRDRRGRNVLISTEFWYWGRDALWLPDTLLSLVKRGPCHRCDYDAVSLEGLVDW